MTSPGSTKPRIFRTGTTVITEDDSTRGLSIEQVRTILKRTYPELADATSTETTDDEGQTTVTFMPRPGRKG